MVITTKLRLSISEITCLLSAGTTQNDIALILAQPLLLFSIAGSLLGNLMSDAIANINSFVYSSLRDRSCFVATVSSRKLQTSFYYLVYKFGTKQKSLLLQAQIYFTQTQYTTLVIYIAQQYAWQTLERALLISQDDFALYTNNSE